MRRRVAWVGSTAADITQCSEEAKLRLGLALRIAQDGGRHASSKRMKGTLREVTEIVAPCSDGTYRLMYAAQLGEVIHVLHVFKKRAHDGIATPRRELELIAQRLRTAKAIARDP